MSIETDRQRKRHILVLSASVGAGHLRAAQAVELALRQADPTAVVANVDVMELTNAPFRRVYAKAYLDLANHAPHVLGYFYDLMDRPRRPGSRRDWLRRTVERANLRRFEAFLEEQPWDVAVNTHFLPAEIIASLRRNGKSRLKQITVTTDFEVHRLWVNPPCDHYCTATEEGSRQLEHQGVPAGQISVTGIPIHPAFSRTRDRQTCAADQGLDADRPIVLQLAGGFGVGPVEELLNGILQVSRPLQAVVVAGRNEKLKQRLSKISAPSRHRLKVLGFTDKIDELMAAADVVVSKPGGLTTSEALASGAAMAVVNPIPGQESRNSDFLLENGAAIKINSVATLAYKLGALLDDPKRLAALKASARRLGRPRAAFDVARLALAMADDGAAMTR